MARKTRRKRSVARRTKSATVSRRSSNWLFIVAWVLPLILALGTVFTPGAPWTTAMLWGLILVILGLLSGYSYKVGDSMPLLWTSVLFVIFMQWAPVDNVLYLGSFINSFLRWFLVYLSPLVFVVVFRKLYGMLK